MDPLERLRAFALAYLEFAPRQPGIYRVLFMTKLREGVPMPERDAPSGEDEGVDTFNDLLALVEAAGPKGSDAFTRAAELWAALHGYVALKQVMPAFPWPSERDYVDRMIEVHMRSRRCVARLAEVGDAVDRTRDHRHVLNGASRVHSERLVASVIEDRDDDIAAVRQRPAHLDLAVAALEAAAQLEDPALPRVAAHDDSRALTQLPVGGLCFAAGARAVGEEELCHRFVRFAGRGGNCLRSLGVILRIFNDPSLTWR